MAEVPSSPEDIVLAHLIVLHDVHPLPALLHRRTRWQGGLLRRAERR